MRYSKWLFSLLSIVSFIVNGQQNMMNSVNSSYDEQHPVISPDGHHLYFTLANHPDNVGGKNDAGDIWYSTWTANGTWSIPKKASVLNNKAWNGVLGFADGGRIIYLMNHYVEEGQVTSQGIARSFMTNTGWSSPENIHIPYFRNTSKMNGGYINADASLALFSLQSYDTRGGEDIYVSFSDADGMWSEPKNLGYDINTEFQEFSPFLSDDTRTLYFATNSQGNGTDIYKSTRLDDTWLNWSDIVPLTLLNTDEGRETGLRIYDSLLVYTSTVNSDGYGDIKIFVNPDFIPPPKDTMEVAKQAIKIVESTPEVSNKRITIFGEVINADTQAPIPAKVTIGIPDSEVVLEVMATINGYKISVNAVGTYRITVDAPGYMSYRELLELGSIKLQRLRQNYQLQPIEVGTTINLKSVLFKQSKAQFLESSYEELDLVVDFMRANPTIEIRLEGHTDNKGIAKYNLKLSQERVKAVKDYLVKHGISKKRISGKGYGGSRPLTNDPNPASGILNRRVEFTIIKN